MKKTLTMLVALAFVAGAQGVAFTWNSSSKIQFNGTTTIAEAGGITANLYYLGSSSAFTIEDYAIVGEYTDSTAEMQKATTSTGLVSNKGKYTGTFDETLGAVINGQNYTAGDYFIVLLTYNDGEKTWYNLASAPWQLPTNAENNTLGLTATFTHSYTMQAEGTPLTAGGGWVTPIPEPATAALALAGLAMLIRRRK